MATQRHPTRQTPNRLSGGFQSFLTVKELAALFRVTCRTPRRWVKQGLIVGHYRYLGGTRYQLVFLESEVSRFMDEFLPSAEDLDSKHEPGSRGERVKTIRRLRGMARIYVGRARATKLSKRLTAAYGVTASEVDDNEDAEPATLDRGSSRQGNNYPDRPSISDRSDEGWDEDVEGKG